MTRSFVVPLVILLGMSWGAQVKTLASDEGGPASKAIEEIGETRWYDPEKQSVVPIPVESQSPDSAHRNSRWLPGAKRIAKPTSSGSSSSAGWFNTGVTTGNLIGWGILGISFVALAAALLYAVSKLNPEAMNVMDRSSRFDGDTPDEQKLKRMEELPAELRRTDVDLRTEAERLMKLGDLDEAIKCLFGHQLLLLDHCGMLRLARGKTNGRYVSETRRGSVEAGSLLRETVAAFEASYFGRHSPTIETFRRLWHSNERLEKLSHHEPELMA